jgi:hypothetical protein
MNHFCDLDSHPMTCAVTESIGAYVLGRTSRSEQARLEVHLRLCVICRAAVEELRPVVDLLGTVDLADLPPAELSPGLLDRVLAAAAVSRRRHRLRRAFGAAALVAAGAGVVVAVADHGAPAEPGPVIATATENGVTGTAELVGTEAGTRIHLRLSGIPADETCRLIVRDKAGEDDQAATWSVGYRHAIEAPASTSIPVGEISELGIVTATGRELLSIPVELS